MRPDDHTTSIFSIIGIDESDDFYDRLARPQARHRASAGRGPAIMMLVIVNIILGLLLVVVWRPLLADFSPTVIQDIARTSSSDHRG